MIKKKQFSVMNEFIKALVELIQNSVFFQKYGYKNTWLSGSSTTVHPIENYITGRRITIQLDSHVKSQAIFQRGLNSLVQEINAKFGEGTVAKSYINMNDGSCPPVAIIFYQEPNYDMKQPVKLNENHLRNIIRESLRGLLNEGPGAGYYVTISGLHATNVHITGRSRKENGTIAINFKANLVPGVVAWEAENYDGKVTSKGIVYDGYLVDEFDDETNQIKGGNIAGYVYEDEVSDSFNNVDEPLTLQQVVEFINDKLSEFSFKTLVGSGYVHTNLSDPMSFEGVEATVNDSYYGSETVYMDVITIQAPGITEAINWFFENYYNFDEIYGGEEEQIQEAVDEKAKSKAQQRFMGMVHAVQKGELDADEVGSSVAKAAKTMKKKDVKDFAETKHKGLPNHVDEGMLRAVIRESLKRIVESPQMDLVKTLGKYTLGKVSSKEANKAIMDLANSSNGKDNLSESLDDEMAKWGVLSQDEFYKTLIQLRDVVKEDGIIDASDAINDYPATYCVYGSEPEYENRLPQLRNSIAKSVIRTLYNYDIICADENTLNINVENSNVPQAAELCVKLQQLVNNQLNESYAKDGNYTHFAVNKTTNKIVNGWDYSGYDASELRQFARDYFTEDLMNYELDPKQYTILTKIGCKKRGINPDDDTQWANK